MFKIKTTIDYLHKLLLLQDEIDSITIEKNFITIDTKGEVSSFEPNIGSDPITELFKSIDEADFCLDCLTDDNMQHDGFFRHLVQSYVHFLMLNYGPNVPISHAMASFFLKHSLSDDYYIFDQNGDVMRDENSVIVRDEDTKFVLCRTLNP